MVTFRNQARQVFLVVYAIIAGDSICYGILDGQFQKLSGSLHNVWERNASGHPRADAGGE